MWVLLAFLMLFPSVALSQISVTSDTARKLILRTVATLPSASATSGPLIYIVTDGNAADDCTTGGGSTRVLCHWNG